MSRYFIEGETLTDIADAIRLKRDTVDEINPEDMPLAISLIDGGGGGDYSNPLNYLGPNPTVVYDYTEHFTLADLSFDKTKSYSSAVTLRTGGNLITYGATSSDKDYVVLETSLSRITYTGDSGKQQAKGTFAGYLFFVNTSINSYLSSERENAISSLSLQTYMRLGNDRIRAVAYGLKPVVFNPTVTANANPTSITLKSSNIQFASHTWALDAAAVPLIDVNNSYIDLNYKIIETDRYNLANAFTIPNILKLMED